MKAVKIIRDPIYGNIVLDDIGVSLLDTPQMQRLRHVKQNGLCFLVYPAMNSTRFEHSLGVLHLASLISDHLKLDEKNSMTLKAAALLHDVGHCAFSHTSESVLSKFGYSHEGNASKIILGTGISDILRDHGLKPEEVSNLILGRGPLSKILSSEIDIDKMDYLIRDSYYAGVAYGVIDLERILYSMRLAGGEVVVGGENLDVVESLLISRNMMYQTVYRHHTKRIAESMMIHALNAITDDGKLSYDEFIKLDDIQLTHLLRNTGGYPQDIMERIDERRLFKIVFQERANLLADSFRDDLRGNVGELEDKIAEDYSIPHGYLYVDLPEVKLSEFKVMVEYEGGLKRIDEVSSLAKALEKSEQEKQYLSIYVPPEHVKKIREFNPEKYIPYRQTKIKKFM